jgi:hypothetical protein
LAKPQKLSARKQPHNHTPQKRNKGQDDGGLFETSYPIFASSVKLKNFPLGMASIPPLISSNNFVFHHMWSNTLLDDLGDISKLLWGIEKESDDLLRIFGQTHKKMSFRSAPASTYEMKYGTSNANILHFSGHGFKVKRDSQVEEDDSFTYLDFLAFEYHFELKDDSPHLGKMCRFSVGDVQTLSENFKFKPEIVCLCACHSELIGKSFLDHGVRHVIAIKR